jgi:hypothetical protein
MSIERRLQKLEGGTSDANSEWVTPIEVSVHCKAVERSQALRDGKELPAYSREEIAAMRQWDLETVEGKGVEARLRDSPGWRTPGSQELLDEWEEEARRRHEATEGLPPERWHEVWSVDDEEEGAVT